MFKVLKNINKLMASEQNVRQLMYSQVTINPQVILHHTLVILPPLVTNTLYSLSEIIKCQTKVSKHRQLKCDSIFTCNIVVVFVILFQVKPSLKKSFLLEA